MKLTIEQWARVRDYYLRENLPNAAGLAQKQIEAISQEAEAVEVDARTGVMIDIETLGTRPGSVILTVGLCRFGQGRIIDQMLLPISAESCEAHGLKVDAATALWWMRQNDDARQSIDMEGYDLEIVLKVLSNFINKGEEDEVIYCKGASFDFPILAAAYDACKMEEPWNYWQQRCYRTTLRNHAKRYTPFDRPGGQHEADLDAIYQAENLMRLADECGVGIYD